MEFGSPKARFAMLGLPGTVKRGVGVVAQDRVVGCLLHVERRPSFD